MRDRLDLVHEFFDERCQPLQAGHLIAAILGGPGDDLRNFIPLTPADNKRMYHEVEKVVQRIVEKESGEGAMFTWYVRVEYNGDGRYPARIIGYLELTGGEMKDGNTEFSRTFSFTTRDGTKLKSWRECDKPKPAPKR